MTSPHHHFMSLALEQARIAFDQGETPVGAVIVVGNTILARACNLVETRRDSILHAEMLVLTEAMNITGSRHLPEAVLYSTLEPCPMCAAAALLCRIKTIVFGAPDLRWGACGTLYNLPQDNRFNHRIEIIGGIMEAECGDLMKEFFASKR